MGHHPFDGQYDKGKNEEYFWLLQARYQLPLFACQTREEEKKHHQGILPAPDVDVMQKVVVNEMIAAGNEEIG
jgi:hypothetical protein